MNQLEIDLAESDEHMIRAMADEALKAGEFRNWDHAYECMWERFEFELQECHGHGAII